MIKNEEEAVGQRGMQRPCSQKDLGENQEADRKLAWVALARVAEPLIMLWGWELGRRPRGELWNTGTLLL